MHNEWYKKFRKSGMIAKSALYSARLMVEFENREDLRIGIDPEYENYFDVYGEPDTKKEKESIMHYLDLWGLYTVYVEYKCKQCGEWILGDSVGMCCYEDPADPLENWYIPDLIAGTIAIAN